MDPIQMSSFRQECEGLLEKEAIFLSPTHAALVLGGPAVTGAAGGALGAGEGRRLQGALAGALGGYAGTIAGLSSGLDRTGVPSALLGGAAGGYLAGRIQRGDVIDKLRDLKAELETEGHLEKEANIAAKWKAIEAGGKMLDPRRWAKGFGLGVERAGQMIQAPIKTTREGWKAMGSMGGRGGWTGTGKNPFTGKASKAWGWTRNVPVGMKGMTAGFAGHGVYSGAKKQDPYGENRSRTERVMGAVGGGLGWAAMPFGMVPAITTSMLAEKGMGAIGKGIHGTGQAVKSMSSRRKALQAQELQAQAAQYAQRPEVRETRNRAAAVAASRAAGG